MRSVFMQCMTVREETRFGCCSIINQCFSCRLIVLEIYQPYPSPWMCFVTNKTYFWITEYARTLMCYWKYSVLFFRLFVTARVCRRWGPIRQEIFVWDLRFSWRRLWRLQSSGTWRRVFWQLDTNCLPLRWWLVFTNNFTLLEPFETGLQCISNQKFWYLM